MLVGINSEKLVRYATPSPSNPQIDFVITITSRGGTRIVLKSAPTTHAANFCSCCLYMANRGPHGMFASPGGVGTSATALFLSQTAPSHGFAPSHSFATICKAWRHNVG